MTESDKTNLDVEQLMQRKMVPDTLLLQDRILQATATMPQAVPVTKQSSSKQLSWSMISALRDKHIMPWLTGGGVLVGCALLATVLLSVPGDPATTVEVVEVKQQPLSDELAWQDLMLMHDELAFNDL